MTPLASRSSGTVLVGLVVEVVVPGARVSLVGNQRLAEEARGGVRVAVGQDEPGERLRGVCIREDAAGQRECGLRGQRQHPLQVGHHQHRG